MWEPVKQGGTIKNKTFNLLYLIVLNGRPHKTVIVESEYSVVRNQRIIQDCHFHLCIPSVTD